MMLHFSTQFINSLTDQGSVALFAEALANTGVPAVAITELAAGITYSFAIDVTSLNMAECLDAEDLPARRDSIGIFIECKNTQATYLRLLTAKIVNSGVFRM
uniref:Uncharacterized protein n=1 Tax=Sclerotinia borealis TaxID=77105 RepID=A0A088CR47_9HELO|nr:hypothetical protein SBORM_0126 [Sclerotinia borealis]AIJ56817.1 hypothetical protein SBORM_0126 [Sclerotinia borealis]